MAESRRRRLGGWGFEGESYPVADPLRRWLFERLGSGTPLPWRDASSISVPPPARLPPPCVSASQEPLDRLRHARGQALTDLIRLRTASLPAVPDAVARPENDDEVENLVRECARAGVRVIPWGGGTSVTGGVNVVPGDAPVVSLDLENLSGLTSLDETSGLATFGAGTRGPEIERTLSSHGLTLGHFPQSFELSTLGGWVVTRASGQESLGYGSIEAMVAGLELVAPAGRLSLPAFPASAAGPDLRQHVLGSEGRLGVVTRATVRVRRRSETLTITGTLLPSWEAGLSAAREILQTGVPLNLLRLSDAPETQAALAIGLRKDRPIARVIRRLLSFRGIGDEGAMMLTGGSGNDDARAILRRHGGVGLGTSPGRRWLADRFRHPYLRDALLDIGVATDTIETAAPWSGLVSVVDAVRSVLPLVLCHVSHPYRDGASLYFTFFFPCPSDPEEAVARWAELKRGATAAIVSAGGTLTHHHGVGLWHAPWYESEAGPSGKRIVDAAARTLDPTGVLNPHVLLDPTDRLEL